MVWGCVFCCTMAFAAIYSPAQWAHAYSIHTHFCVGFVQMKVAVADSQWTMLADKGCTVS